MKKGILRVEYSIKCSNYEYFIQAVHKRNISIYKINYSKDNVLIIVIDYVDNSKIFAICKNMCYNILKIKYKGLLSPFFVAFKNLGLVIGVILFCIVNYFLNDLVLGVDYTGSASIYKNHTDEIIREYGVEKYSKFSSINLKDLETYILENNSAISYVSCKKSGNRLIIDSSLSKNSPPAISRQSKNIVSDVEGVVEKITILRGTPQVNVGDYVLKDSVLIGGYQLDKEGEMIESFALGYVSILYDYTKTFDSELINDDFIDKCIQLAKFDLEDEVIESKYEVLDNSVKVTLKCRHVTFGG